jgi:hypothetical protein
MTLSPKGDSLVIILPLKFELKDGSSSNSKQQDILEAKEAAPNMSL